MTYVPATIEGAYLLHFTLDFDFQAWHEAPSTEKQAIIDELALWVKEAAIHPERDAQWYQLVGNKGDFMLVVSHEDPGELAKLQASFQRLKLFRYAAKNYAYFSVVELSMHGLATKYQKQLTEQGLEPSQKEWNIGLDKLLDGNREMLKDRLYPKFPDTSYICFYPMDKKRGEQLNWFLLSTKERGMMMRSHGLVGRKYLDDITQIIGSSVGLDDYDWSVDLFSNNCLQFKKLIYEMRFDEVSAKYADFGPFVIGHKQSIQESFEF